MTAAEVAVLDATTARAAAGTAASRAGVRVELAADLTEIGTAYAVVDEVWRPRPDDRPVSVGMLRALTHAGNYCSVAFAGATPLGVSIAFLGTNGRTFLHSHITGVVAAAAGRNVGRALKLDQRAWALERGVDLVTWTYDPLIRRNAYFNANRLGALPSDYLVDFYGDMTDAINRGQHTDRLAVDWRLDSPAVSAICDGDGRPAPQPGDRVRVLVVDERTGGPMRLSGPEPGAGCVVEVPADIEAMRAEDPALALEWRLAVREVLGGLLADRWRVTAFTRSGHYVLDRPTDERITP